MLKRDFDRYSGGRGGMRRFIYFYFSEPGFRAIVLFRFADYLHRRGMTAIARLVAARIVCKTGADIRIGAQIGSGLVMRHPVGIVIGHGVTVGKDCTILQNVTLGERLGRDGKHLYPTISDRVTLCAGAVVIGGVSIGADSVVAANAVVLEDVPANSVVAGVPAKRKRAEQDMFSAVAR